MSVRAVGLACLLALASPAAAAECPELSQLARATRLQPSLAWVLPMVVSVIASADDGEDRLSTAEMERMGDAARDAYSPMALASDVESALAARCSKEAVADANAFYRSALGVKIVRGGMELLSHHYRVDEQQYLDKLLEDGVSSGRLDLARSVKSATVIYALTPRTQVALFRPVVAVYSGSVAAAHARPAPSAEQVSEQITFISATLRPYLDRLTDLAQLYSTRNLSEAELQEYRQFLGSRAGTWYRDELASAFENALDLAGRRLLVGVGAP